MKLGKILFALLVAASCEQKHEKFFGDSPVDRAKLMVMKFAVEAFPQWAHEHPDKTCPSAIDELIEFMDYKSAVDPWGNRVKLLCPPNLPPGARGGIAIVSAGEDGKEDTADDVRSWE